MFKKLFIVGLIFGSTISLSGQSPAKAIFVKDTITDKDLVVPEEIERNFDELLVDWKTDMKRSNSCTSGYDSGVTYPDSVYINRLYSLPTMMELAYNPIVRSYIDMYTGRMRGSVEVFLGKSDHYFPIFERALDKYGLPLELKYLPVIESALNPTIVSRAGATGLWQFMIGTGKMYGLEINSLVDERRDPVRSTDAAARYLRDLFNIYGDWNLVIAAYNCGPGNVNKAIRRNGGQSDYWSIYPYLPRETRGYVPAFIAATYAMNYSAEHNICPSEYEYNSSTDTIVIDKYLHFQQLSDVLNVPMDEIRTLNPQFKNDIVPGEFKKYTIKLPSLSATNFHVNKDSVYSYKTNEFLAHRKVVQVSESKTTTTKIRHKVRRGENLSSIASKYGVTIKEMRSWNKLRSNKVRTGQVLAVRKTVVKPTATSSSSTSSETEDQVYSSTSNTLAEYFNRSVAKNTQDTSPDSSVDDEEDDETANQEARTPDEPQTIYHKVRIGETVALIATKYNVDEDDIAKWNKLKSAFPKVGQRLVIHLPAKPEEEESLTEKLVESTSTDDKQLVAQGNNADSEAEKYRAYGPSPSVEPLTVVEESPSPKPTVKKVVTPNQTKAKIKSPVVYTVKRGDTLSEIVNKMGGKLTAKDVMKANKLKSDKLKVGQKLKIPR